MTYDEAEQLFEIMLEHRSIWPKRCVLMFLARHNEHTTAEEIKPAHMKMASVVYADFGTGIYDPEIDTRVEMWSAGQVDQVMATYTSYLRAARPGG